MEKETTLESNVEKVLEALRTAGYCESTILNYQRVYVRLLRSATIMQTDAFNNALADYFVNDSANVKTGQYCHSRKLPAQFLHKKTKRIRGKGLCWLETMCGKQS